MSGTKPDRPDGATDDVRVDTLRAAQQARVLMNSFEDALAGEKLADMRRLADLVAGCLSPIQNDRPPQRGR